MNISKENTAIINPDITCCNCLKETKVNHIEIGDMGYGSSFDGWSTKINLCDDCYKLTNPDWWKLETTPLEESGLWSDFYEYKYEDKIFEFIRTMPIAGQELFWNRYKKGDRYPMESQDWIDYELDLLPHEKCKEYGMYSPQERQAYKDRFPICKHVQLKVYNDGSSHTKCFRSAFGNKDGSCEECNISSECYMCNSFEERVDDIKVIDVSEEEKVRETERLKDMIKYATDRLKKIENKTLKDE